MAITTRVGTPLALVPYGSASNSIDVGSLAPDGLTVVIAAGGNNDLQFFATVKVGGLTLTYVDQATFIGRTTYIYELLSPAAMTGIQTFELALTGSFTGYATPYALRAVGAGLARIGSVAKSQAAFGGANVTLDAGADQGIGIMGAKADNAGSPPVPGTTDDGSLSGHYFGHEAVASSGSRSVGFVGGAAHGAAGVIYRALARPPRIQSYVVE